jgi:hypothetical protein
MDPPQSRSTAFSNLQHGPPENPAYEEKHFPLQYGYTKASQSKGDIHKTGLKPRKQSSSN